MDLGPPDGDQGVGDIFSNHPGRRRLPGSEDVHLPCLERRADDTRIPAQRDVLNVRVPIEPRLLQEEFTHVPRGRPRGRESHLPPAEVSHRPGPAVARSRILVRRHSAEFTMIELIVAMAIIAVMAAAGPGHLQRCQAKKQRQHRDRAGGKPAAQQRWRAPGGDLGRQVVVDRVRARLLRGVGDHAASDDLGPHGRPDRLHGRRGVDVPDRVYGGGRHRGRLCPLIRALADAAWVAS